MPEEHVFSVYDIFEANAVTTPDAVAIQDSQGQLTFRQALRRIRCLASGLSAAGIKKGERIAVLAMNHPEYLLLFGAAAAAGAVLVPLNWRLSQEELARILTDAQPAMLFFDPACQSQADALTRDIPGAPQAIAFHGTDGAELSLESLMVHEPPLDWTPEPISGPDLFCLIYTAAVGGIPRGAALSHDNITIGNLQTCRTMGLGRQDVYLNLVPLFHITGMNLALATLQVGGKNTVLEKFDVGRILETAGTWQPTLIAAFPPMLKTLLEEMKDGDLSSLNHVTGIDAPDTIEAFTRRTGSRFWALYGQSETSGFVTLSDYTHCPGSAGRPCALSRVAILDEAGRPLPQDTSGEIGVKGPVVFQGFWKNGTTERSTLLNGWHRTGDMGRIDPRGYLWFEGRKPEKELIKPGGENVYPAEVEKVIQEHPDIETACVIGVPDDQFGEAIKAVCVRKSGSTLDEQTLISFVADRIARYKKPRHVIFIEAMPLTRNKEIDRADIKARYG